MIFDSDVVIWCLRGNERAARRIQSESRREISVISFMELIEGARNKDGVRAVHALLNDAKIHILPLTENIGYRASLYSEEYFLRHGLHLTDALLAATAVENQSRFCSANYKHFRMIPDINLEEFIANPPSV